MAIEEGRDTPERIFARRQRQERERRGWRYQDLAEAVAGQGLTLNYSAFAKTETAGRAIRLDEAVAVSAAFGLLLSQMTAAGGKPELERELEEVRAGIAAAMDDVNSQLGRAVTLRNRERELIIAIGDAGEDA